MYNKISNDDIYHTIIIEPKEEHPCYSFYNIFCCCFVTTDNTYAYV